MSVERLENPSIIIARLRNNIINEAKSSKHIDPWFLPKHLLEVEKYANLLCDKFSKSDRDVVTASVWYHDIGRLRGIDNGHDIYGAEEANRILSQEGLPVNFIAKVYEACRAHRCKDVLPESLEAKILATADAMSHFTHGFYFRLFQHYKSEMEFDEIRVLVGKKLDRDFNDKIAFDEAREEVREIYEAMKLVLQV